MEIQTRRRLVAGIGIALSLVILAMSVLWLRCGVRGCPDVDLLRGYLPDEASVVLDRNGDEVGKVFLVHRVVVELEELPEHVPGAFVAVEDRRFWRHGGIDWPRVVGAALRNVQAGGTTEGGSTITMQLSRNLFPDQLPAAEKTIWRKFGEMRVAREIERRYTKSEILELYLNQIYFGNGAWGIEAAAQEYFGKPAVELTLAEAALLAGLPQAPSRMNPRADRQAALGRRDVVLDRMQREGMVSAEEAEEAKAEDPRLARSTSRSAEVGAYFMEEVRRRLEPYLGEMLYTGGLRIHTTMDLALQEVAERELERQLRAVESGAFGGFRHARRGTDQGDTGYRGGPAYLQGALVVMDARAGDVLALVGGRDFGESQFNRATQARRQMGSAFKPFVYAAALARGYPPTLPLEDQPIQIRLAGGQTWTPSNYGGDYAGRVTMRRALVQSRNIATVNLSEQIGLRATLDMARRLGLNAELPAVPSVVLGSAETNLLDLTSSYTTFATLGTHAEPRMIVRVEDRNGRIVWEEARRTQRALDPPVAFLTTSMLQDVVDRGTATAVRAVGFSGAAAGKTGTTNDAADVWFIGYTPATVAGVWIGFDERKTIVARASGGTIAAPVWGRVMRQVGAAGGWSPPPGIEMHEVDELGNVSGQGCMTFGEVRQEYFIRGTAGLTTCVPHDLYAYPGAEWDTLGLPRPGEEDDWWEEMRERLEGDTTAAGDTMRRDTTQPPPAAERRDPSPAQPAPEVSPPARRPNVLGQPARGSGGAQRDTSRSREDDAGEDEGAAAASRESAAPRAR
jgi:penicillin-binding protein 1A